MGNPVGFNAITVPSIWEMAGNELQSCSLPAKGCIPPQYAWAAVTIPQDCQWEESVNVKWNLTTPSALQTTLTELNAESGITKKMFS